MSLLDLLKKKKKSEKPKKAVKAVKKVKEVKPTEGVKEAERPVRPVKAAKGDIAWRVLRRPHVTEKATMLAERNQYTFDIWPKAHKTEVKKAVEDAYGVNVDSVRIIQARQKIRRRGRIEGLKRGSKKAIVKLREGQKIEVLPR